MKVGTKALGKQLRHRTTDLGLTTIELAERSGVSRTTIWRLMRGEGGQLRSVQALARTLGLTLTLEAL